MSEITRAIVALGKIASVVLLVPLSFCVALPIGLNELKAVSWAQQYDRMPHPTDTRRIAIHQAITKLSNGDNCDFVILEARSYVVGQEPAIQAFYAERANPLDPRQNALRAQFVGAISEASTEIEPYASFRAEVERVHQGPYYLLEAWQVVESGPPLIDWRCP